MLSGLKFPVSDFYSDCIREGTTLSRGGKWWSAALLIEDPKSKRPFIGLYLWQLTDAGWKKRKSFNIRSSGAAKNLIDALNEFGPCLD